MSAELGIGENAIRSMRGFMGLILSPRPYSAPRKKVAIEKTDAVEIKAETVELLVLCLSAMLFGKDFVNVTKGKAND